MILVVFEIPELIKSRLIHQNGIITMRFLEFMQKIKLEGL